MDADKIKKINGQKLMIVIRIFAKGFKS